MSAPLSFVEAFARLLAPKPLIYVFRALKGKQYCADEIPGTYQVVIGVSERLYHDIANHMLATMNADITDRATVMYAGSLDHVFMITIQPAMPLSASVVDFPGLDIPQQQHVCIRPRDISGAA